MDSGHQPDGRAATPSAAAREQEDRIRDTVGTLTDLVPTPRVRRYRLRVLIGLLMMVLAGTLGMLLLLRQAALDDEQRVSAPAAAPAAPAADAPAAPAADAPAADAAAAPAAEQPAVPAEGAPAPEAPTAAGGCVVDPAALTLASTVTLRDRGVNDPAMFLVQWDSGVINNTGAPILVTALVASADGGAAWEGSYVTVAPGQAHVWPSNYVTNNAGGSAGATTWQYVDRVLAVPDTPECAELLSAPADDAAGTAIPAVVPRLPANAHIPVR